LSAAAIPSPYLLFILQNIDLPASCLYPILKNIALIPLNMATDQQRPASQKLPLATVLNSPEEHRDSAYYSSTDASSKRA
jgi:hypothetical protein